MNDQTNRVDEQSNGFGTAAMVCGIVGLVLSFIPILGLVSWALAPLAIIFGFIGLSKKGRPRGQAVAGLTTGSIALFVCLMWLALVIVGAAAGEENKTRMNRTSIDVPADRTIDTI